jgi:cysteine-rich repeat protein
MRSNLIKAILVPVAVMGMAAFFAQACSGDPQTGEGLCVPGRQETCLCDNNMQGVQSCNPDGQSYSACNCQGGVGGGSSSSSSGTGVGGGAPMGCVPGGSSTVLCGNGMIDSGEQCDDGNCIPNDACSDKCLNPFCGDKIVQAGEDCDDGQNEVGDMCPDDCKQPDAGTDAETCADKPIFYGLSPSTTIGQWSAPGKLGYEAGTAICQSIGAFGVCDYEQLKEILNNPAAHPADAMKLAATVPAGGSVPIWVHRTTPEMVNGMMSAPGPGGRCNDWVYPTGHVSNGEWLNLTVAGGNPTGTFTLDPDTVYTGVQGDGHVQPGFSCGPMRYIPCCYKLCTP